MKKIQDPHQIIKHLKRVISHLDDCWEKGESCIHPDTGKIVSNTQYDAYHHDLEVLLKQYTPDDSFFSKPSLYNSNDYSSLPKINHNPPMTSISKIGSSIPDRKEALEKWMKDTCKKLKLDFNIKHFVTSWKHDGIALALYYENGILKKAGLRADDGRTGIDVTEHTKYIKGIPQKLNKNITCSIRGEVECLISVFEQINKKRESKGEKTFANTRNYTAGSMGLEKSKEIKDRGLSFIAYSIENIHDPPYSTEIERAKWCNKELNIPFVQTRSYKFSDLEKMENMVSQLDYEVDGVVVSINNLKWQKSLGHKGNSLSGNPHGKIAWKFKEKNVLVIVNSIEWQVGRTGRVIPVLHFDPVPLSGTKVSKCTAHNAGLVKREKIGIGAEVKIEKSGKIIPKVIDVIKKSTQVKIPKYCPCCESKLQLVENNSDKNKADLLCKNSNCSSQSINSFVYYLKTLGIKGLGQDVIGKLVDHGLLNNIDDFYKLSIKDLMKIGITKRTALLSIARIHMVQNPEKIQNDQNLASITIENVKKKKEIKFTTFLTALGINGVSKNTSKILSENYNDLPNLIKTTKDELVEIDSIGEKTAQNIIDFLEENKKLLTNLSEYVMLIKDNKDGKFSGKKFVLTGFPPNGKQYWVNKIEENGGIIASSVSKKIDYVIVGTDAGAKEDKARKLFKEGYSIEIIDNFNKLEKML